MTLFSYDRRLDSQKKICSFHWKWSKLQKSHFSAGAWRVWKSRKSPFSLRGIMGEIEILWCRWSRDAKGSLNTVGGKYLGDQRSLRYRYSRQHPTAVSETRGRLHQHPEQKRVRNHWISRKVLFSTYFTLCFLLNLQKQHKGLTSCTDGKKSLNNHWDFSWLEVLHMDFRNGRTVGHLASCITKDHKKQPKGSYFALSLGSIRFLFCKLLKRSFSTLPSGCRTQSYRLINGTLTWAWRKACMPLGCHTDL